MELTPEQVLALAPDTGVATSGKKLAITGWHGLGRDAVALWGEYQGSAHYQVRAALGDLTVKCSCPSRKFPCKHGIGLLLLVATDPDALPTAEAPEWVSDWIQRRASTAEQRETKERAKSTAATDGTTPVKRASKSADRRLARVQGGLDALDLWLDDLLRGGLAQVATQPATFWERQAARLVDAQAPGLAGRLRRMAALSHASRDWPALLLVELGRVALLTHSFRRIDELDPALREDLRGAIGWTLTQDEVLARGEVVGDRWLVLGQRATVEDRLRTQRTWLLGATSGRYAMILQFAHGDQPFEAQYIPGTGIGGDLVFWPSAWPLRAAVRERHGEPTQFPAAIVGLPSLAALLEAFATAIGHQPWLPRLPAIISAVTIIHGDGGHWLARDEQGATLPLLGDEHWHTLALSGGAPVDLIAEWDGATLLPLGLLVGGSYHRLGEGR